MDVILHGPPGAGKGTQSENICQKLNIVAISTGDLIRYEIKNNTEMGQQIKDYSSQGLLVPDELVMDILSKRLEQPDVANGVLFDGFPRTIEQASMLKSWLNERNRDIDAVFSINITDAESLFRCTYRIGCSNNKCKNNAHIYYHKPEVLARSATDHVQVFKCPKCGSAMTMRNDAVPLKVKQRIKTYHETTEPMLPKLRTEFNYSVYDIDGMPAPKAVSAQIDSVIAEHLS